MGRVLSYPKFQVLDNDGSPLSGGKVYTYNSGTTIPLVTYSDAGLTIPNTNPIILDARGEAWIFPSTTGIYTIEVFSSTDVLQWSKDGIGADASSSAVNVLRLDLADSTNVANGDAMIAFKQPFTGAQPSTIHDKMTSQICAFDFMTDAEKADVRAGTALLDVTTACQNALNAANEVHFPAGTYKITASLLIQDGQTIRGAGRNKTIFKAALGAAVFKKAASPATFNGVSLIGFTVDNTSSATAGGIGVDMASIQASETHNLGFKNVNVGLSGGPSCTHYFTNATSCVTAIVASGATYYSPEIDTVTTGISTAVDRTRVIGGSIVGTTGISISTSGATFLHFEGIWINASSALTASGTGKVGWVNNFSANPPNFGSMYGMLGPFDFVGANTPEGALAAPVGATYRRSNGGAATSFYVKESGTGNTGWVGK